MVWVFTPTSGPVEDYEIDIPIKKGTTLQITSQDWLTGKLSSGIE